MLAPWFNAPLGSRQVSRHFQDTNSGGTNQFHLHLDGGTGRQVPKGYQTILTHAFVGMTYDDPAPNLIDILWDDTYGTGWDIWSPEQGALTPLLPLSLNSTLADAISSVSGAQQNGVTAIPCPPLVAPIVLQEGHRAFVRATSAANRALIAGWVVGFTMPVVNDVPGNRRYFTEDRRP